MKYSRVHEILSKKSLISENYSNHHKLSVPTRFLGFQKIGLSIEIFIDISGQANSEFPKLYTCLDYKL